MKYLTFLFAVAVSFAGFVGPTSASEVSKPTLNAMGLSGMQQLSDHDGMSIRGKGTYATVWGSGTANLGHIATQTSGYTAGASHHQGSSLAVGGDLNLVGIGGQVGNHSGFLIVGALGGSFAFAK